MKIFGIIVGILIIIAIGSYFVLQFGVDTEPEPTDDEMMTMEDDAMSEDDMEDEAMKEEEKETLVGTSVNGNDITAYNYGTGDTRVLFVGGIHGGYSWNTALVAYELMDYLEANPDTIPDNVTVSVIPVLNPDGLEAIVGTTGRFAANDVPDTVDTIDGRFNANNVDLNRNFDCDWQEEGVWQNRAVSGGSAAFSEPEAAAFRDYVTEHEPEAVVVWYSAGGGVFSASCHNDVSLETRELTDLYADAAGYDAYQEFNFYEITGDMVNWLAKENITGISVLLSTHTGVEWTKNRAGIMAILDYYAKESDAADTDTQTETE